MPAAIALITGVVVLAFALIGIIWSFLVLMPFYAFVGVAGYLLWRSRRNEAQIAASVAREAETQRQFNEQEALAWHASLSREERNAPEREKALKGFDKTPNPLQK
jgi:uncharacterized membrane protein YbaN (DUF454 family)